MRLKHVPSHMRNLKKTIGSGDTKGLDVDPLAMKIDRHAQKRIEANKIIGVELIDQAKAAKFGAERARCICTKLERGRAGRI
ncbi:hypothetical protein ACR2XN_28240 [Klebsiella pneumoniae]